MSAARRRRRLFEMPCRATAWGIVGCAACFAMASAGLIWALVITVVTALAGCWAA
jgi:hypothetical protein